MADVEQTQNIVPFITCEISPCQYVCELKVEEVEKNVTVWTLVTRSREADEEDGPDIRQGGWNEKRWRWRCRQKTRSRRS